MIPRTSLVLGLATLVGCANPGSTHSEQTAEFTEDPWLETAPSSELPGFELNDHTADIDPEEALDEAEVNLEILAELDVFEVGELILDVPAEAFSCYGWPCPEWADEIAEAQEEASVRLAAFTEIALYAISDVSSSELFPEDGIGGHLDTLRGLEVIEIGELIEDEPVVTGNCYNLPCPEEIAAAEERNNERAWQLEAIANATRSL